MNSFKNILGAILVFTATYFVSWAISTTLIWVIFKLFSLAFDIKIATGIWLVLILIEGFLKANKK